MVATISARKNIAAARQYFIHLKQDDYYLKNEEQGIWAGRAAQILGLDQPISRDMFTRALNGQDPMSGDQLTSKGHKHKTHQPGWDICLSAPKSVSILWALAPNANVRDRIALVHKNAVDQTCVFIEQNFGKCRRGKGGKIQEKTAGLLFGQFHHKTSRSLCPQLHSHVFTFNLAPRIDGSWGALLSKPLYSAQKKIGEEYRKRLHKELRKIAVPSCFIENTINIDGIGRDLEMVFSVRRKQILSAVKEFGYANTVNGFQKATLRTRQPKMAVPLARLIEVWHARAETHGYALNRLNHIFQAVKNSKQINNKHAQPTDLNIKYPIKLLHKIAAIAKNISTTETFVSIAKAKKAAQQLLAIMMPKKHQRGKVAHHKPRSR